MRVLVELGQAGGRTGCRTLNEAEAVARAVADAEMLELAGVEGFEGLIPAFDAETKSRAVDEFLDSIRALLVRIARAGLFAGIDEVIVSVGGSIYFDRVVHHLGSVDVGLPIRTVLRSGCYVTHDHGTYEASSPMGAQARGGKRLRAALEVWGAVWSRPEAGLAIVGVGKRDAPSDYGLPTPLRLISERGPGRDVQGSFRVRELNDQHAYVEIPQDDDIQPGDRVIFGISHPCAAFDRWRLIPVVDDEYNVIDAVETFF